LGRKARVFRREAFTRGLCGKSTHVYHPHDGRKVIALHRWDKGGPADDAVFVANFFHEAQDGYVIGFPASGSWKLRFNSDWNGYSDDFSNHPSCDVVAEADDYDSFPCHETVSVGPYSVLIFSR